jgi:hypothetical protein
MTGVDRLFALTEQKRKLQNQLIMYAVFSTHFTIHVQNRKNL